jgi:hypothetical protein
MTDEQIIKALECCIPTNCLLCPYDDNGCLKGLHKGSLDLINRQKAEIERLRTKSNEQEYDLELLKQEKRVVRAEAIKEFERTVRIEINEAIETNRRAKQQRVERLNAKGIVYDDEFCSYCDGKLHALCGIAEFIDNLVKEMVGEG